MRTGTLLLDELESGPGGDPGGGGAAGGGIQYVYLLTGWLGAVSVLT